MPKKKILKKIKPRIKDQKSYEREILEKIVLPILQPVRLAINNGYELALYKEEITERARIAVRNNIPQEIAEENIRKATAYHFYKIQRNLAKFNISINKVIDNANLAGAIEARISTNVKLIKTIPPRLLETFERKASKLLLAEKFDRQALAKLAQDTYKVTKNQARVIARDQISKTMGLLDRERQLSAGIDKYIWRTSGDDRVREAHQTREGNEYSWHNSDIIPTEDIQCRCSAEGVIP